MVYGGFQVPMHIIYILLGPDFERNRGDTSLNEFIAMSSVKQCAETVTAFKDLCCHFWG